MKSIADGKIIFSYKDYADGSKTKMMTLRQMNFEAVLYAYITTSIYENKALWVFGK
ncbi:MAG: hypothetical protein IPJ22_13385 [Bacteroidetes bacterium]|nr:hypothetical protein [Bacteroidota bacterium]